MRKKLKKRKTSSTGGVYFSSDDAKVEFVHTGCTLLDCTLGGGWPLGRIVNIVGDRSSGKTLLAIEACANFAKTYADGKLFYMESEAAFNKSFARSLGMPVDRITFHEEGITVEDFYANVEAASAECKEKGVPGIFVLDSLDALSDNAEMARGIDDGSFGANKAKKLSELFRRVTRKVESANLLLIIISQVRANIGVTFGKKTSRSGGKALDFYASQIIYLTEMGKIKKTVKGITRPIGVAVRARVEKNKVGMPFRECEFEIMFGYGIDSLGANIAFLASVGDLSKVKQGLNKTNYKRFIAKSFKLPDKEYRDLSVKTDKMTVAAWDTVEEGFASARSKY